MKRRFGIGLSVMISLLLLLATFSAAEASGAAQMSLPVPQITLLSGNASYSSEVIAIQDLPGVTSTADGMLVPVGYADGSKQFEGAGLKLSGLGLSSAKLCFATTGGSFGWGGKVAKWDGKKWQFMDTTLAAAGENPYSWACTTVYADGTYTLIKWVVDPSKITSKPNCGYQIPYIFFTFTEDAVSSGTGISGPIARLYIDPPMPDKSFLLDKTVTVTILTASPTPGDNTFSAPATGTLIFDGGNWFYFVPNSPVIAYQSYTNTSTTFHLDFGSCFQDVTVIPS